MRGVGNAPQWWAWSVCATWLMMFFFGCRRSCWIEIPVAWGIWPSGFFVAPTQVFDRYFTHWYPLLVISFSSLWACLKKGHLQRHAHKNWWNKKHQKTGHVKKQAIPSCWWSLGPGRCVLRWPASMACEFVARMGVVTHSPNTWRSYFWRLRQWVGLRENLNQKAWFLPLLGGFLLIFP